MAIALYYGGFKPPTKGHFKVAQELAANNFKGYEFDYPELVLRDPQDTVSKVIVFIGPKDRNGIGLETSKAIWDIYSKHLTSNIEILTGNKRVTDLVKDYAKKYDQENFYIVRGVRNEEDEEDLEQMRTFKNLNNATGLAVFSSDSEVSGTALRNLVSQNEIEQAKELIPDELSEEDKDKVIELIQKDIKPIKKESLLSKKIATQVEGVFNAWFDKDEPVKDPLKEGSGGTPIAPMSAIKSSDRNKLVTVYKRIKNVLGDDFYKIIFNQDHIRVQLKGSGLNETLESESFDFTPHIASILEYMIDEGMNILPIPEVKLVRDEHNAKELFGKTAHYSPVDKEIVLYIEGRHPKDVLRSFTHEMIHHKQNLENRLNNISTTNTNEDDNLLELEKEAYLEGNITFRNWEDGIKNSEENLNEESKKKVYENLADELAEDLLHEFHESGKTKWSKVLRVEKDFIDFDLEVTLEFTKEVDDMDGQAYAVTDFQEKDIDYKDDDLIQVYIKVNPYIKKPYTLMQVTLIQFLVHEMRHLIHGDGTNRIDDEYVKEDNKVRSLINMGAIPAYAYRLLPREIDAAVHEFISKANVTGREFKDIVDEELDKEGYTEEEKNAIIDAYKKYIEEKKFNLTLQEQEQGNLTFYLDMDGVLADFDRRFTELAGQSPDEYKSIYGKKEFWKFIGQYEEEYWTEIPLMKGAEKLTKAVLNFNYEILTSPSKEKSSRDGKENWIEKYKDLLFNGEIPKVNFEDSGTKHTVKTTLTKKDILIDDRSENIDPWIEKGGTGILYKNINQVLRDVNNEITSYKVSGKE